MTYSPTGDVYAVETTLDQAGTGYKAQVHRMASGGSPLGSSELFTDSTSVDVEYGADGRIYAVIRSNGGNYLTAFNPTNLSTLVQVQLSQAPDGLHTRPDGLVSVSYAGSATFLDYATLTPTTYPTVSEPIGQTRQTSVAADADIFELGLTWDSSRGEYPCDLGVATGRHRNGASWRFETDGYFSSASTECKLSDIEAMPGGGAVISAIDGFDALVRWLDDEGALVASYDYAPTHGTSGWSEMSPRRTDLTIDDTGRVILAVTVPDGPCPEGSHQQYACSRLDIVGLENGGQLFNVPVFGDTGNSDSEDDSAGLYETGNAQQQELQVVAGTVMLPLAEDGFYCGHACSGHYLSIASVTADVVRRTWEDPPSNGGANPPPPASGLRVAIAGDSYIAGEGAFDYLPGDTTSSEQCHRSERSWAFRLALDLSGGDRSRIDFIACSGTTTQEFGVTGKHQRPTQLSQLTALSTAPDVLLLSLGGNDIPFGGPSGLVSTCVAQILCHRFGGEDGWFRDADRASAKVQAVLSRIREALPQTAIYLMGYPSIVSGATPTCDGVRLPPYLSNSFNEVDRFEREWIRNSFLDHLNGSLETAADAIGVNFVDPKTWFTGHELCTDTPWANGSTPGTCSVIVSCESFHPNTAGYNAMYQRMTWERNDGLFSPPTNPSSHGPGTTDLDYSSFALGSNPDSLHAWGATGTFSMSGGPAGTSIQLGLASYVPTLLGVGTSDEAGNVTIPFTLPAGVFDGVHLITAYDASSGQRVDTHAFVLGPVPSRCAIFQADFDGDGDGLPDRCDAGVSDGSAGDFDEDGVRNERDNCPTVSNPSQVDADANGFGDSCDPERGYNSAADVQPPLPPLVEPTTEVAAVDDCGRSVSIRNTGNVAVLASRSAEGTDGIVVGPDETTAIAFPIGAMTWEVVTGNTTETRFEGSFDCAPPPPPCSRPEGPVSGLLYTIGESLGPSGLRLRNVAITLCGRGL